MRAWGIVARNYETDLAAAAVGTIDLLSALNGGRALGCSNKHYGEPRNLLRPGRGENMGAGWETARNPRRPAVLETDEVSGFVNMPGVRDWAVLRLAAVAGQIESLTIDTHFFRGNFRDRTRDVSNPRPLWPFRPLSPAHAQMGGPNVTPVTP